MICVMLNADTHLSHTDTKDHRTQSRKLQKQQHLVQIPSVLFALPPGEILPAFSFMKSIEGQKSGDLPGYKSGFETKEEKVPSDMLIGTCQCINPSKNSTYPETAEAEEGSPE